MPFGLFNAFATLVQRTMKKAIQLIEPKTGEVVNCYTDDLLITNKTIEAPQRTLREVFGCVWVATKFPFEQSATALRHKPNICAEP